MHTREHLSAGAWTWKARKILEQERGLASDSSQAVDCNVLAQGAMLRTNHLSSILGVNSWLLSKALLYFSQAASRNKLPALSGDFKKRQKYNFYDPTEAKKRVRNRKNLAYPEKFRALNMHSM